MARNRKGFTGSSGSSFFATAVKRALSLLNLSDDILLVAINRRDGSIRWRKKVGEGNKVTFKQNLASPSPVTDGRHVWVMTGTGTLTRSGNAEIAHQWLLMSVRNDYEPTYPRLEGFLTSVGRRKFLKPLYGELSKTPRGRERARAIYKRARRSYHPLSVATVDEILGWSEN